MRAAFWIAGIVLLSATLLLAAHLSGNALEFSRYNTGWNGTSVFFSGLDRHRVTDILDPAELAAYRAFLERGNMIVIADDFGTGNAILKSIGSRIVILPGNLSSIDREYADPYSIVVYRTTNTSPVQSVSALVLNRPAPLEGGEPLIMSSIMSWVDRNGDKRINSDEVMGKFPVMAKERIGSGELVVLSDPSIFVNTMQDLDARWDNQRLIQDLVDRTSPVLIDQMNSRTSDTEGMSTMLHVLRTTLSIEIVFVVLLMLFAAVAWRRKLL